jgi:hypothetical protein
VITSECKFLNSLVSFVLGSPGVLSTIYLLISFGHCHRHETRVIANFKAIQRGLRRMVKANSTLPPLFELSHDIFSNKHSMPAAAN